MTVHPHNAEQNIIAQNCSEYARQIKRDSKREENNTETRCSLHMDCAMGHECKYNTKTGYKMCNPTFPTGICMKHADGDTLLHEELQQRLRAPRCEKSETENSFCTMYRCTSTSHSTKTSPINIPIHLRKGYCDDVHLNKIVMRDYVCNPVRIG